jgi:hypothetical protein
LEQLFQVTLGVNWSFFLFTFSVNVDEKRNVVGSVGIISEISHSCCSEWSFNSRCASSITCSKCRAVKQLNIWFCNVKTKHNRQKSNHTRYFNLPRARENPWVCLRLFKISPGVPTFTRTRWGNCKHIFFSWEKQKPEIEFQNQITSNLT